MSGRVVGLVDRKTLWGRSGGVCAFPDCDALLVEDLGANQTAVVVSQECHIVASADEGPRGDPLFPASERDRHPNLILLCLKHHKVVDDDPDRWSVNELRRIKKTHEARVQDAMGRVDRHRLADEIFYADTVTGWVDRIDLDAWGRWTSGLLQPRPSISRESLDSLNATRMWLLTRPWPGRFDDLESAFGNFRRIADALIMAIEKTMEDWGDDALILEAFYKAQWFEQDVYDALAADFDWIVSMINDLTYELSRAANRVVSEARATLDPTFRLDEGTVWVEHMDGLTIYRSVPRYGSDLQDDVGPFVDVTTFSTVRRTRDIYMGTGVRDTALRRITPLVLFGDDDDLDDGAVDDDEF